MCLWVIFNRFLFITFFFVSSFEVSWQYFFGGKWSFRWRGEANIVFWSMRRYSIDDIWYVSKQMCIMYKRAIEHGNHASTHFLLLILHIFSSIFMHKCAFYMHFVSLQTNYSSKKKKKKKTRRRRRRMCNRTIRNRSDVDTATRRQFEARGKRYRIMNGGKYPIGIIYFHSKKCKLRLCFHFSLHHKRVN